MNMINDVYCGVSYIDINRVREYALERGFGSVGEWMDSIENPKMYRATVSLLKARLARINELSKGVV